MYYNARWYDPTLGRFAQADSIVPPGVHPHFMGAGGLDRYAYVNNSPMNYVDPGGHFTCSNDPENDDYCPNHSPSLGGDGNDQENTNRDNNTDTDNDGYPNIPDPLYDPVELGTHSDPSCSTIELTECFYSRGRLPSGDWTLSEKQLADLMLAVYYDIHGREFSPFDFYDRIIYDTPFWDGYGADTGNICLKDECYDRNEVNYFAQGMYSAKYEGKTIGLWIVDEWNENQYSHPASPGEKFWFEQGYEFYVQQAWFFYGAQ